jgi:hypothetical protein
MMKKFNVVDSIGREIQAPLDEKRVSEFGVVNDQLMRVIGGDQRYRGHDAQEALAFLVSQLAYTEAQTFERMYTPMQYEQLIPISFEAGEWADTIRYEIYDFAGRGKRTSGKGKDINLVEAAYADKSMPVLYGNVGYDYTAEELRRTSYLRRPINSIRLQAAIEAYKRHMNDVGLHGESASNVTGLFNNASVPQGSAPNGAWLTPATTEAQILADINTLIQNIWSNTAFNDLPDTIVIAPSAFSHIATMARSTNSDMTVLQFIKKNNIAMEQRGIDITFVPGYGLDTAGVGATKRMMGYVKNPTRLIMHIPLPLRFLTPQPVGLSIEIPGEYKYSGVEVRYPKSAYYMDGI